jgi:hypothetical protein
VGGLVDYQGGVPEQWLATIGDITFSPHWVLTPTGTHPLRGSVWTVTDRSHVQESVSAGGVILCLLFVWFCLLGLLFLLLKDRRLVGYFEVTVQGSGFYHSTLVPVQGPQTLMWVNQQVNYARALAAAA